MRNREEVGRYPQLLLSFGGDRLAVLSREHRDELVRTLAELLVGIAYETGRDAEGIDETR